MPATSLRAPLSAARRTPGRPSGRVTRRPASGVRLLVRRHRRLLVALCLAVASGLAVDAATAAPPRGVQVAAAARNLPAGHVLTPGDLRTVEVPPAAVPVGTLARDRLVGDVLAAPVRDGEVLTDVRVLASANAAVAPGHLALPVRLGDEGAVRWLRPGVRVRVLAVLADPVSSELSEGAAARVVAREVVVLDVPDRGGGGFGLGSSEPDGAVVLLSVPEAEAGEVAAAGAGGWLTVALLP